jgi:hypothetical protein
MASESHSISCLAKVFLGGRLLNVLSCRMRAKQSRVVVVDRDRGAESLGSDADWANSNSGRAKS